MPVIPKLASTIILMDNLSRIYLTKRPKTMKFLGGFYVFPGGTVEKKDSESDQKYIINTNQAELFNQAHYVAAARELFEEVGILLCQTDDGSSVLMNEETEREYRRLLLKGEISFLQMLKTEGIYLNLSVLQYFGNRITPKDEPIRYNTRFFLTILPEGQFPKPDYNEIDEAMWITPKDALAAYQDKMISLATPTIHALEAIRHYLDGGTLTMSKLI